MEGRIGTLIVIGFVILLFYIVARSGLSLPTCDQVPDVWDVVDGFLIPVEQSAKLCVHDSRVWTFDYASILELFVRVYDNIRYDVTCF